MVCGLDHSGSQPFNYSSVYTSTCRFAERAVLRFFTHHFMCTTSDVQSLHVVHRPPMSPARPKCLALN